VIARSAWILTSFEKASIHCSVSVKLSAARAGLLSARVEVNPIFFHGQPVPLDEARRRFHRKQNR
jgi:hypothetical protein